MTTQSEGAALREAVEAAIKAMREAADRMKAVKRDLDLGIPDGEPVAPQSSALTWPAADLMFRADGLHAALSALPAQEAQPADLLCECEPWRCRKGEYIVGLHGTRCRAAMCATPQTAPVAQPVAGRLQGGMTNDELRAALRAKLPNGAYPEDEWLTPFALGVEVGAAAPAQQTRQALTEADIAKAVFAVLRKHASDPLWKALTYDSGPYEVTNLRTVAVDIARAIEAAHGISEAPKEPKA